MGLNILSPTGRAAEARFSQPQMQQLPPDQFMAQLSQEPISMVELMYLKQQYDRLKSSQPPASLPQTTVADDLRQAVGQAQVQPPQQQGAGIAALPVPDDMYQTKGMAGGGIVAFAHAGSVGGPYQNDLGGEIIDPYEKQLGEKAWKEMTAAEKAAAKRGILPKWLGKKVPFSPELPTAGRVLQGVKSLGTAGGLMAAGRGLAGLAVPAALGQVDYEAFKDATDPVPTDVMRKYYADKGLPVDPVAGGFWGDIGIRTLGEAQRFATLGLTGPQRQEEWEKNIPAAAAAPSVPSIDTDYSRYLNGGAGGGGGGGYGAVAGVDPSIVAAGFDPVYGEIARQRKAVGPVDAEAEAQAIKDEAASMKAAGIGTATEKADVKNAEAVAALPRDKRRDAWLDAANAFFAAGAAGGQTGSFAEAMSVGALKGVNDYKDTIEYYNQKKERLDDKEMQIGQAREALAAQARTEGKGDIKEKQAKIDSLDALQLSTRTQQVTAELNVRMKNAELKAQLMMQQMASAGKEQAAATFLNTWTAIQRSGQSDAVKEGMLNRLLGDMQNFQRSFAPAVIVNQDKIDAAQQGLGGVAAPAAAPAGRATSVRQVQ